MTSVFSFSPAHIFPSFKFPANTENHGNVLVHEEKFNNQLAIAGMDFDPALTPCHS
jgi:hypothetical protein